MEKIKKLWQNNKVFIVLGIILIICFIAIISVSLTYFFGGSDSVYGDRLIGIDDYEFTSKIENSYLEYYDEIESVKDVSINQNGKILYIHINFIEGTSLDDAKNVASGSIESLDETMKEYYDLNFIIESPAGEETEGFVLLGAKNVISNVVSWNNNTAVDEGE